MSVFGVILVRISCIRTEHREIWSISPYSAQMRENADQNNSEYGHFSDSDSQKTEQVIQHFLGAVVSNAVMQ